MTKLKRLASVTVVLAAILGTSFASGPNVVEPGFPAPAMAVKNWYKGNHVTTFAPDKTYVVEFWATWCGPCRQSIPHLSEVAKKNQDVTFVGVSIWEDDTDGNIQKFVQDMGDKMSYNVGYSGNKDGMAKTWMDAAGQNGIPCAFIVKNGNIQWVGHPMEIDKPLSEIKAGTFDVTAFRAKFDVDAEKNRKQMALNHQFDDIIAVFDKGDHAAAKTQLADFVTKNPDMKRSADMIKFGWLAKEDPAAWEIQATQMAQSNDKQQRQEVLGFAIRQTEKGGNMDQGHKALDLVMKATAGKDMLTLEYAQAFYKEAKDYKNALAVTNQIIDLIPNSPMKNSTEFKDAMTKEKKDLELKATQ